MRPVDADEVYSVLVEWYHIRTQIQHMALKEALGRVPTVEPKRGHWIERDYNRICSECGATYWKRGGEGWKYCPECGVKMDKGENEDTN